jgi:GT2 family glycosyltransferase
MNLSIIIPTWNTAKVTLKCIETIQKYLKNFSYEIIVVDNGSTDDTLKVLFSSKVKIIKNKQNLGFAKANNQGVKTAQGDYLLFLNSDMELINSSLIDMFNFIKYDSQIGIIGPQFLNTDLTPQSSVFPPQTSLNAFKEFWLNQKNAYSKYLPSSDRPSKVSFISGGAMMIKKSFFESLGGWNEKYFFYFEDMDLCRKVGKSGKEIVFFPLCKVIHRHGFSGQLLADNNNQWRRLIPSSIKYHGFLKHYFINFIIWSGQKWQKLTHSK